MSHVKKKPPIVIGKAKQEQTNKKALLWIGVAFVVIVVSVTVLLIVSK